MATWRQHHRQRSRGVSPLAWPVAFLLAGAGGVGYFADGLSPSDLAAALPGSGCNVKGNVSQDTGERIYHVPGQRYYSSTVINASYGERWFCSEAEARKAGWRRSKV